MPQVYRVVIMKCGTFDNAKALARRHVSDYFVYKRLFDIEGMRRRRL